MTREEASAILSEAECEIAEEKRLGNDTGWQLKLRSGAVVNVFDKGSYNVQGKNKATIQQILDRATGNGTGGRKVFVVYGHDEDALQDLEVMLRRWGLEPLILGRLPSGGQTVPHPVSWTHVYATRHGVARIPRALRAACDTPAFRGASTGCSVRRTRRRPRAPRRGFERPGRRRLAP